MASSYVSLTVVFQHLLYLNDKERRRQNMTRTYGHRLHTWKLDRVVCLGYSLCREYSFVLVAAGRRMAVNYRVGTLSRKRRCSQRAMSANLLKSSI